MRTCVACRTERPKRDLQRVVRTVSGAVQLDPSGRLAGRGAYLCPTPECLAIAVRKGALGRALHISPPAAVHQAMAAGAHDSTTMIEGEDHGQE